MVTKLKVLRDSSGNIYELDEFDEEEGFKCDSCGEIYETEDEAKYCEEDDENEP